MNFAKKLFHFDFLLISFIAMNSSNLFGMDSAENLDSHITQIQATLSREGYEISESISPSNINFPFAAVKCKNNSGEFFVLLNIQSQKVIIVSALDESNSSMSVQWNESNTGFMVIDQIRMQIHCYKKIVTENKYDEIIEISYDDYSKL